ncbi:MAG: helix-turn-helix transcriptional regulator [Oscillospiraceae bacterium]
MVKLVTRVKEARQRMGMTQQALADQVGVRRETILHLENGRYNPSLKLAMDISAVFGRSVEMLFHFEEARE